MNIVRELQRDALRLRLCAWGPCSRTATTVSWWKPTASAVLRVLEIPITSQCRRKVPKKLGTHRPTAMTKVRKGQQQFWFGDLDWIYRFPFGPAARLLKLVEKGDATGCNELLGSYAMHVNFQDQNTTGWWFKTLFIFPSIGNQNPTTG